MVDGYFPEKQDGQPGVLGARENSGRVAIGAGVDALSALGAQWGSVPEGKLMACVCLVPPRSFASFSSYIFLLMV